MKIFTFIIVLAIASTLIYSCSEDIVNDIHYDLLPLTIGSYWIYNDYELDTLNQRTNEEFPPIDSTAITGTEEKLLKQATVFTTYIQNIGGYDKSHDEFYYTENENIYTHSDLVKLFLDAVELPIDIPFDIKDQWMLFINPHADKWDVYEQLFDNDSLIILGYSFIYSGSLIVTGEKAGQEELTVNGEKLQTYKYTLKFKFDVTGTMSEVPGELNFELKVHFWYANRIGKVRQLVESMTVDIPFLSERKVLGNELMLNDYNILE
jgi:hypothetical protein